MLSGLVLWVAAVLPAVQALPALGSDGVFGVQDPEAPTTTIYKHRLPRVQRIKNPNFGALPTGHVNRKLGTSRRLPFRGKAYAIPEDLEEFPPDPNGELWTPPTPASTVTNIFEAISTDPPPINIPTRDDHPYPRIGIKDEGLVQTNKFYGNFFLACQCQPAWTQPYTVWWSAGSGDTKSWGLAISHAERDNMTFGEADPAPFFAASLGVQHLTLSAVELGAGTTLSGDSLGPFSVNINLTPAGADTPVVRYPLVQGMGFVSAVYENAQPLVTSEIGFNSSVYGGSVNDEGKTFIYTVTLANGFDWVIYVTPTGSEGQPPLELLNPYQLQLPPGFTGLVQIAKIPADSESYSYDIYKASAGAYPMSASVSGTVNDTTGSYILSYQKAGDTSKPLLMFALPHLISSFDETTAGKVTALQLTTVTKGLAVAVAADNLTMIETGLPTDISFAPSSSGVSPEALEVIKRVALAEVSEDFDVQTNLNSMYYSGKGFAKFAMAIIAAKDVANDTTTALGGLGKLKVAFDLFVQNTQKTPLCYDSVFGGVVSTGSYAANDSAVDFGNTFYNDHHFHYGYFVYTAAVIAYLDPAWLDLSTNRAWIEMLIRDYSNPSTEDPSFPFSRNFDWYHGHSWASGLYELADGKNEESSSEDVFSTYALRMWGIVTNNPSLAARALLQLAVTKRSLQHYFLLQSDNTVQPPQFIGNKVTGILFENKIDHATFFGANPEYVQGIHMIPLNPASPYVRSATFVQEEWDTYFSGDLSTIEGPWRSLLLANKAIIDQAGSYAYFSDPAFNATALDGGASLAWYLAFSASNFTSTIG